MAPGWENPGNFYDGLPANTWEVSDHPHFPRGSYDLRKNLEAQLELMLGLDPKTNRFGIGGVRDVVLNNGDPRVFPELRKMNVSPSLRQLPNWESLAQAQGSVYSVEAEFARRLGWGGGGNEVTLAVPGSRAPAVLLKQPATLPDDFLDHAEKTINSMLDDIQTSAHRPAAASCERGPSPSRQRSAKNPFSPTKGGIVGIVAGVVLSERHVQEHVGQYIPPGVAMGLSVTDPLFYLEQTTGLSVSLSWGLDQSTPWNPYGTQADINWSKPQYPIWKAGSVIMSREIEKERRRLQSGPTTIPCGPKF
jgi:hypothetical protein